MSSTTCESPPAAAIEPREPRPRRVPRDLVGCVRRRLRHRLAHGVHQLRRDAAGVGVVRVGEDDDADLAVRVDQRLGRVARIAAAVADVDLVAMRVTAKPMPLPRVQLFSSKRTRCISRSEPVLRIWSPPAAPLRNCAETNFAMSSTRRGEAGRRGHAARVDERHDRTRSIRHAAAVAGRQPGTFLSTLEAIIPSG